LTSKDIRVVQLNNSDGRFQVTGWEKALIIDINNIIPPCLSPTAVTGVRKALFFLEYVDYILPPNG
jgi:hypothetical protein